MEQKRNFGLLDGMILIGALALALGLLRADWSLSPWPRSSWLWWGVRITGKAVEILFFLMICLGPGLLMIRMRRPRPPRRRLFRQAGTAACLAATVLGLSKGLCPLVALAFRPQALSYGTLGLGTQLPFRYGPELTAALLGAWIAVEALGVRCQPGWIEKAGKSLACLWLMAWFVFWMLTLILMSR